MTQDRPHRPALGARRPPHELQREVRAGRIDRRCRHGGHRGAGGAAAEAAGQPARRPACQSARWRSRVWSRRGARTREIAERLVISRRTAEHHVQHIYAKVGVSSRAGLALFAHEHDLIADTHPPERAAAVSRARWVDLPMRGGPPATRLFSVTTPLEGETEMPRTISKRNRAQLRRDRERRDAWCWCTAAGRTGTTGCPSLPSWPSPSASWPTTAAATASASATSQGSRRDQEDDLAALIEGLGGEPANVVGHLLRRLDRARARRSPTRSWFGASIAHEPPLISVAADDPEVLRPARSRAGHGPGASWRAWSTATRAARRAQFVEEVALGPGAWELLPAAAARDHGRRRRRPSSPSRQDPMWASVELDELANIACPLLITEGDASPPWFGPIVAKLADAIDHADVHTYRGRRSRAASDAPAATTSTRSASFLSRSIRARGRGRHGCGVIAAPQRKENEYP